MEGAKEGVEKLLSRGAKFTFQNFSTKSQKGYTEALSPDWVAWRTRVVGAIERLFHEKSAPIRMVRAAAAVNLIGNDDTAFKQAKSYYMGALEAALQVLEEDNFGEIKLNRSSASSPMSYSNKIFIVHGHDEIAKQELEIILTEMGLEPVVLHRQPDGGRTLIEKFEHYADVGFAFVIMTADEIAYVVSESEKPDDSRAKQLRARPNVIFEFGFFVGRLGRSRTCCLYKGDVVLPSDLNGLIYKRFEKSVEETAWSLARELKAAGYVLKS